MEPIISSIVAVKGRNESDIALHDLHVPSALAIVQSNVWQQPMSIDTLVEKGLSPAPSELALFWAS